MLIFTLKLIGRGYQKILDNSYYKAKKELIMFKMAVDMASDQIVITDTNGIILYANKALESVTGYSPEEVVGKKAGSKELWGGNMKRTEYERLWQTIKNKEPYYGEFRNRRKDGSLYDSEVRIYPILDRRGRIKYFAGLEMDISDRKQLDRIKSEFVSLASHQLRSPLTGISLSLDLLLRGIEGELSAGQKKALQEIRQSVHQTSDLVRSLLDLSRIEMGSFRLEKEPVEIRKTAKSVINENLPLIKAKNIRLAEEYRLADEILMFDQSVATVVLQNLLSNAAKYTPVRGRIDLLVSQEKNQIHIKVADTGVGIPQSEQQNIFSKFYRATNAKKTENEGNGLGLSLLKPIIEAAGGRISFFSEENKGSVFSVVLPVEKTKI